MKVAFTVLALVVLSCSSIVPDESESTESDHDISQDEPMYDDTHRSPSFNECAPILFEQDGIVLEIPVECETSYLPDEGRPYTPTNELKRFDHPYYDTMQDPVMEQ